MTYPGCLKLSLRTAVFALLSGAGSALAGLPAAAQSQTYTIDNRLHNFLRAGYGWRDTLFPESIEGEWSCNFDNRTVPVRIVVSETLSGACPNAPSACRPVVRSRSVSYLLRGPLRAPAGSVPRWVGASPASASYDAATLDGFTYPHGHVRMHVQPELELILGMMNRRVAVLPNDPLRASFRVETGLVGRARVAGVSMPAVCSRADLAQLRRMVRQP
jgi:hypothetical protein